MRVWRISNYADLSGSGGLRASGRWHSAGRRIVYCAPNPAAALLEVLVHQYLSPDEVPDTYQYLEVDIPDDVQRLRLDLSDLPDNWRDDPGISQSYGDSWLLSEASVALEVPSVVAPATWNVLLNPLHPDINRVRIVSVQPYFVDERLR
ncbi:MAG: RES family NAD+ phosphorylase [Pseudomonadota bacterium]